MKVNYAENRETVLDTRREHYADNRETVLQQHRSNYLIPERRTKQLQQMSSSRKSYKRDMNKVVLKFKSEILHEKPIFTCTNYDRLLLREIVFKPQVSLLLVSPQTKPDVPNCKAMPMY